MSGRPESNRLRRLDILNQDLKSRMLPLHYCRIADVTRLELVLRGWKPQSGTESRCAKPLHYTPKLFIDKSIYFFLFLQSYFFY